MLIPVTTADPWRRAYAIQGADTELDWLRELELPAGEEEAEEEGFPRSSDSLLAPWPAPGALPATSSGRVVQSGWQAGAKGAAPAAQALAAAAAPAPRAVITGAAAPTHIRFLRAEHVKLRPQGNTKPAGLPCRSSQQQPASALQLQQQQQLWQRVQQKLQPDTPALSVHQRWALLQQQRPGSAPIPARAASAPDPALVAPVPLPAKRKALVLDAAAPGGSRTGVPVGARRVRPRRSLASRKRNLQADFIYPVDTLRRMNALASLESIAEDSAAEAAEARAQSPSPEREQVAAGTREEEELGREEAQEADGCEQEKEEEEEEEGGGQEQSSAPEQSGGEPSAPATALAEHLRSTSFSSACSTATEEAAPDAESAQQGDPQGESQRQATPPRGLPGAARGGRKQLLQEGEIVFAKLDGYPWWPAQIQAPPAGQQRGRSHRKGAAHARFCVFYGSADYQWVPAGQIEPFLAAYPQRAVPPRGRHRQLHQAAVEAAWDAAGYDMPQLTNGDCVLPGELDTDAPFFPE